MEIFDTMDIDNIHCQFQYEIEWGDDLNPKKVYFKVFSIPHEPLKWFSYSFSILDFNTAKGDMMTNNGYLEFAKKGIPEKIIEIASTVLERKIISSPTTPRAGNYLVGPSYKVWERLVGNNKNAILNTDENRFELMYSDNQNS